MKKQIKYYKFTFQGVHPMLQTECYNLIFQGNHPTFEYTIQKLNVTINVSRYSSNLWIQKQNTITFMHIELILTLNSQNAKKKFQSDQDWFLDTKNL